MRFIAILLLFIPQILLAKTIFEPSLSLNTGALTSQIEGSNTISDGTEVSVSYTTLSAGMRYGITREYIHVTGIVDAYMVSMGSAKIGTGATAETADTKTEFKANFGLGIGYEWNIPLRTYLIIGFPFSGLEVSYYWSETFLIGFKFNRMEVDFHGADLQINTFGVALSFPFEFDYPGYWWRKKDWE